MNKKLLILLITLILLLLLLFLLLPHFMLYNTKEESLNNFITNYFDNCYNYRLSITKIDKEYIEHKTNNQEDILEIFNYINDLKIKRFSKTKIFNPYKNLNYLINLSAENNTGTIFVMSLCIYENNYIKIETYKNYNTDSKVYNFKITNLTTYEVFDNIKNKIK